MGLDLGFTTMEIEGDTLSIIKKAQWRDNDKLKIHAYIKGCQWLKGLRQKEQWNMSGGVPVFAKEEVERERLCSLLV
ncbi:hypothetical protein Gogos_021241 [Gossypium gossypioides]|uniref:RNase H type-1 domain-containing protein n=1 Tax=Gossypium gossypioides TaxID=34282 RepID=A0A7J9D749_GOSGO|nr:hypothetical protein [Gossypium gossypioides]